SVGGGKELSMLTSPLSNHLQPGAIMQSGGGISRTREELTLPVAEKRGKEALEKMGYSSIAEARKATQEELLAGVRQSVTGHAAMSYFSPNADGYVFPKHWNDLALDGDYPSDLPIRIGCTSEAFGAAA
ncbi:MAG: carboxylesterase family protein, partial [Lachnospiraceae bacterium]|nr:carboxylesterase family protein [Lachnospiraceae bacterium]